MPTGSPACFFTSPGGTFDHTCSGRIGRSASVTGPRSGQAKAQVNRTLSAASTSTAEMSGISFTWWVKRPVGAACA